MEAQQPREGATHHSAISVDSDADALTPTHNSSKNKLLLVYPFKVDEEKLQEISSNLTELGGNRLGVAETFVEAEESDNEAEDGNEADRNPALSNTSSRMHYVTIREDDMKRLSPGQFLNSALLTFGCHGICLTFALHSIRNHH